MRIYIPSKNRHDSISTHRYFKNYDYVVLVHDQSQYDLYEKWSGQTKLNMERVIISGTRSDQFGLTRQREYACNKLEQDGNWFVFADDNIRDIRVVPGRHYSYPVLPVQSDPAMRSIYDTPCNPKRFMSTVVDDCIKQAEKVGARHVGFASVDNFYFRGTKWKNYSYIIGKLMLWHNTHELEFDHSITMEDFELTAQSLLKFGVALVNNYVYPVAGHYERGGMGKKDERLEDRKHDVDLLMSKYPQLFSRKPDDYPDLRMRYHLKKQITEWRNKMDTFRNPKGLWS